ncbi:MAG: hypothetical protein PWP04_528 [Candidatus Atribacteria bacterium]|nr:hypothetical protein [Candidatus Atribacteria bacterium]
MVISRFEVAETKLDPKKVAAIVAAVNCCLEKESLRREPYIKKRNRAWKNLALQEKNLNFFLGR